MEIFFLWLVFCGVVAAVANNKGHSAGLYFLLSLVASPLIGILVVLVLKPNVKAVEQAKIQGGDNKKCPFCAEVIKAEATVCRFCGRDMPMKTARPTGLPATVESFPAPARQRAQSAFALPAARPAAPRIQKAVKDVYLFLDGEQRGPYGKPEILDMWNRGDLTEESIYWKEGMPEWQPVVDLI